jgi:hypothetical protein
VIALEWLAKLGLVLIVLLVRRRFTPTPSSWGRFKVPTCRPLFSFLVEHPGRKSQRKFLPTGQKR